MPAQDDGQADCASAGGKWTIFHGSAASCFNYEFIVPDQISTEISTKIDLMT
jgi:hypothetical protein